MDELSPEVALSGRQFYIPTVLGPTGMNGWIYDETLVVREVEADSPADGIALTNDIIHAANGNRWVRNRSRFMESKSRSRSGPVS